ncbi:PREDICTED: uncharacterized protein LOC109158509 [Ipomoea nil]|uniref:uncharacterized protein LOC109158509 n=1 Tax=Ipomoea nil TaxID=35883 RepID=UPI0009010960|nr:PREDICTED: uncharacterized protein LOC109158509 [Ipomoea nil]
MTGGQDQSSQRNGLGVDLRDQLNQRSTRSREDDATPPPTPQINPQLTAVPLTPDQLHAIGRAFAEASRGIREQSTTRVPRQDPPPPRRPNNQQSTRRAVSQPVHSVHSRLGPGVERRSARERLGRREPLRAPVETHGRQSARERNRTGKGRTAARRVEQPTRDHDQPAESEVGESAESTGNHTQERVEMANLAQEVRNLKEQVEGRAKAPGRALLTSLPFSSEIMAFKIPGDFKFPEQATFDGSGDPREHLLSYQAKMQVLGVRDPVMCRAFLPTLKGAAQRWLVGQPPGSIHSFEELADRFMSHYAANIKPQKDLTHLGDIHQDEGESLKVYLARWQKEIQSIEEVEDQTALTFFIESLRSGQLYRDLRDNRPATYADAIQMANKRANTEQAIKHKRQREVGGSAGGKRTKAETRERPPDVARRPEARRPYDRPVVHTYRPAPERPVHEVQAVAPPPPPPIDDRAAGEDTGKTPKYCRYHKSYTHSTEECYYLKKIMEGIIQQGTPPPNQWKRRSTGRGDEGPSADAENSRGKQPVSEEDEAQWRQKPVINMIVGGPKGGDSANTQKAWARQLYVGTVYGREENSKKTCREPIVFTDKDLPAGETPHRDALVIAMDINGVVVRRILVDTGSSVNVLYLETFTKMGLTREQLRPVNTPLAGFTGDSVEAEGSITLPVEIGSYPDVQKLSMKFIVVDLACSHNAILGRLGLEDLGALISIEHLCLKFRTPNGIGTVRCDRKVARDCYLQACRGMGKRGMQVHEITERPPKRAAIPRPEPPVELEEVEIDPAQPSRRVRIGVGLPEKLKGEIVRVLQEH